MRAFGSTQRRKPGTIGRNREGEIAKWECAGTGLDTSVRSIGSRS